MRGGGSRGSGGGDSSRKPFIVTPGVRVAEAAHGGQKRRAARAARRMKPSEAGAAGLDLVVIGRLLRDAPDPAATAGSIVSELAQ